MTAHGDFYFPPWVYPNWNFSTSPEGKAGRTSGRATPAPFKWKVLDWATLPTRIPLHLSRKYLKKISVFYAYFLGTFGEDAGACV